jgi:deoxyhypusine synthase
MLEDQGCTIFLVVAGSTSAAGCMDLYAELVRSNMVDCIVATGATIVDMDFFEGLGHKHYQALEIPDDDTLRSLYIDRIYDTYIDEEELQHVDNTIYEIAESLEEKPHSSRAFIREMGKYLVEHGKKDNSLVKLAYEHDVPIFCPAFTDSSAGFGLVKHQVERMKAGKPYLTIDSVADFRELTQIKIEAGDSGLLMVGGGVPKNFVQDTVVCAEILGHEDIAMHKYAVQITVADVRDGACSSSTLQEAASWGKVNTGIEQMVFAEAGSVMPLLASDAWHRGAWKKREPRRWAKLFG